MRRRFATIGPLSISGHFWGGPGREIRNGMKGKRQLGEVWHSSTGGCFAFRIVRQLS